MLSAVLLGVTGLVMATAPAAQAADEIDLEIPGSWFVENSTVPPRGDYVFPASGDNGSVTSPPSGDDYLYVESTPDPDDPTRWNAAINALQWAPETPGQQYTLVWNQVATPGSSWVPSIYGLRPVVTPGSSSDWVEGSGQFVAVSGPDRLYFSYNVDDPSGTTASPFEGGLADVRLIPADPTISGTSSMTVGEGQAQTFDFPVTNTWGCSLDAAPSFVSVSLSGDRSKCVVTVAPTGSDVGSYTFGVQAQATDGTAQATAPVSLTVPAVASRIELSPATQTIEAGQSVEYHAEAYNSADLPMGDVTAETEFTVDGDASCADAACVSTTAGSYVVTGSYGGASATSALTVTAAELDYLVLSPPEATVAAGTDQVFTADSFDEFDNHIADVTAETEFTVDGDASCTDAVCTSTVAGSYVVTGTYAGTSATAELTVTAAGLDYLVVSPGSATVAAGAEQAFTADSFDEFDNHIAEVTADTEFTVDGDVSCTDATCVSTTAGSYTVTGSYNGQSATAELTVTAAELDHLVLSPASATVAAGGEQAFTADSFDEFDNHIAEVTADTEFTVDGDVSCTDATCVSTTAGSYTVTGAHNGQSATAELTVTAAELDHLVLSPGSATVAAGAEQAFTADTFDEFDNHIAEVTADTEFTVDGDASCTDATCASTVAGSYTVTGSYTSTPLPPVATSLMATPAAIGDTPSTTVIATATLEIVPAELNHLVLSPASTTITAGTDQAFTADSFDEFDNHIADVTAETVFTADDGASCTDATCTSTTVGSYTVTGTFDTPVQEAAVTALDAPPSLVATAALDVVSAAVDHLVLSPAEATIAAGTEQAFTADSFDEFDNHIADVTAETEFTIDDGASCTDATCKSTSAGSYTVTGTYGAASGTATLTVTALATPADPAAPPVEQTPPPVAQTPPPVAQTPPPVLATTGTDVPPMARLAMLVLLIGSGLLALSGRFRRRAE